jgi:hypothetical protein
MDAEAIKRYRERWQAVKAFEAEERKSLTPEQKLEQLNTLFTLGPLLGASPEKNEQEITEVRDRWAILRRKLYDA